MTSPVEDMTCIIIAQARNFGGEDVPSFVQSKSEQTCSHCMSSRGPMHVSLNLSAGNRAFVMCRLAETARRC